ncbi:MAG: hypothetical protein QOE69_2884, partial [Thermoleophilaceae bacterium]|nr:hypothetical protein [Thermoleophilaceae bacterium]
GTTVFRKRFVFGAADSGSMWLALRSSTTLARPILDSFARRRAVR